MKPSDLMMLGDVAQELGTQSWMIRKLFTLGLLPEPPRVGGRRVLTRADLPAIREKLLAKGWPAK